MIPNSKTLLMGKGKDSTASATTSTDWPILQIQNQHKGCLLDAFPGIPPLDVPGMYNFKLHRWRESTVLPLFTLASAFRSVL